jgi:hypothetical protein
MIAFEWCFDDTPWCAGWIVERLAFPLAIAYAVYRLALYQIEKTRQANLTQLDRKREIDFADKQLSEFYAPMVGARAEIFNHTTFDQYLKRASFFVDQRRLERDKNRRIDSEYLAESDKYTKELETFFDGINRRLLGERIDAYIAMRELFAEKMAYADPDTREWYGYFYAFVEMWRVYREEGERQFMSKAVLGALGSMFDEELLQPFYAHLSERVDYLQREIQGERVEKKRAPKVPEIGSPKDVLTAIRERYTTPEGS